MEEARNTFGSRGLFYETRKAVVLSAPADEPAGPPALTAHAGVIVINTARFYCHSHTFADDIIGKNRLSS